MTAEERIVKQYGNTALARLAGKVLKVFRPTDLMHVAYILNDKKMKGFTDAIAYRVATEHTAYAKMLVARAEKAKAVVKKS